MPFSLPTTTSAANDRFFPPLTTLVTRLIEMPWSFRSSPDASLRSIAPLKSKSCFSRGLGEASNASVINVTAAVEHHALDSLLFSALGYCFTDFFGSRDVSARPSTPRRFVRRSRSQCHTVVIVNELRVNVMQTPVDRQSRALGGARNFAPNSPVNCSPNLLTCLSCHFLFSSLARLKLEHLVGISHAFPFIRIRTTKASNVRGNLAHLLTINAGNRERSLI